MIRDLLVIYIAAFGKIFAASLAQDLSGKTAAQPIALQSPKIFVNLLGHRRGQHPGVRPGISHHLFLIQFLHDAQGLVGADLEQLGTIILQFRQIIQKGRILVLLLPGDGLHYRIAGKLVNQRLGVLLFLKAVFLVEYGRPVIAAALHGFPLRLQFPFPQIETAQHPVKRCFYKCPNFALPLHHHTQHTGHHPAHGDHRPITLEVILYRPAVFQGQHPGKINAHQVILLGPQISGITQGIVF